MAIEIVDFPIKNGVFPWQNVSSPGQVEVLKFHLQASLIHPGISGVASDLYSAPSPEIVETSTSLLQLDIITYHNPPRKNGVGGGLGTAH